jgi:Exo-beta-D-glucosaminidase Ig-fold domain
VEVINNLDTPLEKARAHLSIYNLDGTIAYQHDYDVSAAAASVATSLGAVEWPAGLSPVHFVKLELRDGGGKVVSENFYWRALPEHQDDLTALGRLPTVTLDTKVVRRDVEGKSFFDLTLHNPGTQIALMAHLQLRRKRSGDRVLPVYYSANYISLVPNENRTITIEAATADLKGDEALVLVDGWNVGVVASSSAGVDLGLNIGAQVDHWPVTGLPIVSGAK